MPDVGVMRELLDRVKAATGPDRILDGEIMFRLFAVPVGNDVGYIWPEDNPSWSFGLTRNKPVSQQTKDMSARDARREGVEPKEWIEFQREDGRWVLMNDIRIPKLTGSTDAAWWLIEKKLPGVNFIYGRGRTRAAEPNYGCQLLFGSDEILGEGEHDNGPNAICAALLAALIAAEEAHA